MLAEPREAPARRRVVILTHGGVPVQRLLRALEQRGARPAAVLVCPEAPPRAQPPRTALRRVAEPVLRLVRPLRRRMAAARAARALRGTAPVAVTGTLNGARMARDLRRLSPDVLMLAGCGLLSADILSIPREGTVNVHPALLPWARGNGAIEHSILHSIPLGCTAHRVDAGIDTGRIISRRLAPVRGGETVDELRRALGGLWLEVATGIAFDAAAGPLPAGTPQTGRHPLSRAIADPATLATVREAAAAGTPRAAFEAWVPLCDPADLSLPPGIEPPLPIPAAAEAP